jgi:hypothetical protein
MARGVLLQWIMMTSSLAAAALATLLAGQSASDRAAYQAYQVQLARIIAVESQSTSLASASVVSQAGCTLVPGAGNSATTRDCTSCHAGLEGRHSHPVDVDQDMARSRSLGGSGPSLRPAAEVVKRGVFLADGKITCLTCHDGNSTWKFKIALPPDARLREPVKPGNPGTYDPAVMKASAMTGLTAVTGKQVLPAGTEVSPTPLCKVCHSFD